MLDVVNEYLNDERNIKKKEGKLGIWRKPYVCADGFQISIQASRLHYCNPSSSKIGIKYDHVEVSCEEVEEFACYIDDENDGIFTYGFVPVDLLNQVIWKHNILSNKKCSIKDERNKTKEERFETFEFELSNVFNGVKNIDEGDYIDLLNIKEKIIIFLSKDNYHGKDNSFLSIVKDDFYKLISNIEKRHADVSFFYTKLFMEDFYFKKYISDMRENKEEKKVLKVPEIDIHNLVSIIWNSLFDTKLYGFKLVLGSGEEIKIEPTINPGITDFKVYRKGAMNNPILMGRDRFEQFLLNNEGVEKVEVI